MPRMRCFVHIMDLKATQRVSHVMLLFWLQKIWLEVILTDVIPCLEVGVQVPTKGNTLKLSLKPDIVCTKLVEVSLVACLLEVPHFASICQSKKDFGLSFAYDAPRIWNDFPDDVRSAKSFSVIQEEVENNLFVKANPP